VSAARAWPLPEELIRHYGRSIDLLEIARRLPTSHPVPKGSSFDGVTVSEREEILVEMRAELDSEVALALMASCEAVLRADFEARIRRKPRSTRLVNERFKALESQYRGRTALDDILAIWKTHAGARPAVFTTFSEYLGVRHWLAHGRRWPLKVARQLDPAAIKQAVDDLFGLLPSDFPFLD
jgi:hypothetical protein